MCWGKTHLGLIVEPYLSRQLELCHDIELNPGPRSSFPRSSRAQSRGSSRSQSLQAKRENLTSSTSDCSILNQAPPSEDQRLDHLENEVKSLANILANLDTSVLELKDVIQDMRPAYNQALQVLATSNVPPASAKNNLVFHGIPPEPLEIQMEGEPEFCRDVMETRVKQVFREHLRISRDIPITQVYRIEMPNANPEEIKPIVVGFRSSKDKENILRHANLLRKANIYITEDTTGKKSMVASPKKRVPSRTLKNQAETDHLSSCNSDYAPSSHSGTSSGGSAFAD
ncbi:hypothetical protein TCAL_07855 [Tigriopus californicus]|uniref:Uncharacterized protein n=2 Tax=Tigriopus californicus TaxID=6832 RepID=A0A553PK10_TIGCA|nr:hypothetical protein TCAL_07855 [Tigriopus californicus]|eukprot:TCALIF_07855-PA protein Name:"Protein of unknown function" AED:0.08 eAED:0.08 QI:50/1/0.5/1/1/1/2/159/284